MIKYFSFQQLIITLFQKRFIKFISVGLLNTLVTYITFYLLLSLGINYKVAATVGYILGILNSYIWNKYWTFKSKKTIKVEFAKFIIVYLFSYIVNIITLTIFVEIFDMIPEIGEIFGISLATIISYLGLKYYSFKQ